jgi:hypothetical protein
MDNIFSSIVSKQKVDDLFFNKKVPLVNFSYRKYA